MKVPVDMLINKRSKYVQIYEGTRRHVTKQALRYVQINEGTR